LGNGITMTGTSSTLHLGSTVGTVTATSCAVSFAGTTAPTLDDDKATTFKSLTFTGLNPVAASTGTSNTTFKSSSPLTFANGGTLTITNGRIFLNQDATGNIITISSGTPTIVNNGAGVFNFGIGANSVTATIPAISMSGSAGYAFINIGAGYTSGLFDFSGNFSTGTASLTMTARESPSDITFKINGNVFTCGAFTFGCPNIDGKATLIGNGGTINATSWAASNAAYTTGFAVDNMQTSTRNISGSYTVGANHTINAGTSSINLYGTSGVLTTNGKTLYDVYIHNHTTINDGCTFHKLAWGTDGKQITFEAGNTFTLTSLDATDWSGSVGQLNKMISSVPTTAYTIAIPNTITASYMDVTDCTITGGNINVYDGTSTDGGNNSATWVWTAPPATDTIASNLIRDLIIDIDVRVGISVGV
jgi:hypothetical protein